MAQKSTRVALHHIIAEAIEAHLCLHPLQVRRNSFLHVFGSVIKVSAATIIGACIATAAECGTIAGGAALRKCLIARTDMFRSKLIGAECAEILVVEVAPIGFVASMIHYDVSYGFGTSAVERLNEQF